MKVKDVEVERRLKQFKKASKESGIKITHQRLEIFREVVARLDHPDAEAVFRAVQKRMPTVSLDTVYRTLWLLNDLGLITTLGPRRESVCFDANLEHHHHYVCVRCGLTRDFESAELNTLEVPETVNEFGSAVAMHVEVRGVCDRCSKEQTTKSKTGSLKKSQGKERSK